DGGLPAGQYRRLEEEAPTLRPTTPGAQHGAEARRCGHLTLERLAQVGASQRAHGGRLVRGVADGDRPRSIDQALLERIGDRVGDDETLGGDAALPGVLKA